MDDPTKPYYKQLEEVLLDHNEVSVSVPKILPRLEDHCHPAKSETTAAFAPNGYPWMCGVPYSFWQTGYVTLKWKIKKIIESSGTYNGKYIKHNFFWQISTFLKDTKPRDWPIQSFC